MTGIRIKICPYGKVPQNPFRSVPNCEWNISKLILLLSPYLKYRGIIVYGLGNQRSREEGQFRCTNSSGGSLEVEQNPERSSLVRLLGTEDLRDLQGRLLVSRFWK